MRNLKRLCVFCGSNKGASEEFAVMATQLGQCLAEQGITLVYGGGRVGLMGTVADAALAAGGEVIGVTTRFLVDKEVAHRELTKLHIVDTMHERKAMMESLSDGFIMMPGGLGTLDEFCEILTWAQLGLHHKPCGILDVDSYFQPWLEFLQHGVDAGFLKQQHYHMIAVKEDPEALISQLKEIQTPYIPAEEKWDDL